ncbi:hypothetical protein UCYN_03740 [Candidatus Atelocyanobacterium thalassa isolate ALOHA]|uniref:Uncharacterized protein n=1 Tax=Atelocyanobacterium thalassa (isolate ALOHA) TaxID=1453429 RepID=D3ENR1_ATETH|nr:hypothetical protein UCYN_03740 [Candidatus Atelocyanobacterium thalassa isolate ALOHA]
MFQKNKFFKKELLLKALLYSYVNNLSLSIESIKKDFLYQFLFSLKEIHISRKVKLTY